MVTLPILFFLSSIDTRQNAKSFAAIEVSLTPAGFSHHFVPEYVDSVYAFSAGTNEIKLAKFGQYCSSFNDSSRVLVRARLPRACNYGFVINLINVLQAHGFVSGIDHETVVFSHRPKLNFDRVYEDATLREELSLIYSQLSIKVEDFLSSQPVYRPRTLKYTDLGPPPLEFGSFCFWPPSKIKQEPRGYAYYLRLAGIVFPIILVWVLLLILTVRRSTKIAA